jgi:hypothetical protein
MMSWALPQALWVGTLIPAGSRLSVSTAMFFDVQARRSSLTVERPSGLP